MEDFIQTLLFAIPMLMLLLGVLFFALLWSTTMDYLYEVLEEHPEITLDRPIPVEALVIIGAGAWAWLMAGENDG